MRTTPALLLALTLTACGGGSTSVAAPSPQATESEFQAQVAKLEPAARNAVLLRAIRDAGQDCQGVTESLAQKGTPGLWTARCTDRAGYGVLIKPDGTAQVISAAAK